MPVYFIQSTQITGQRVRITGDLAHHLRDVLRFSPGETFDVVDERRRRYRIVAENITPDHLQAEIIAVEEPSDGPPLYLSLAQSVLKRSKMDWVVQKATEIGVAKLVPLVTERTVVRPSADRSFRQRSRWLKIAKDAAQQCGRLDIPAMEAPIDLSRLLACGADADLKLILWELETECTFRSALQADRPIRSIMLVVGPEGGFSSREVTLAREAGFRVVSLGRRILRAETASISALSILQYELGDMR